MKGNPCWPYVLPLGSYQYVYRLFGRTTIVWHLGCFGKRVRVREGAGRVYSICDVLGVRGVTGFVGGWDSSSWSVSQFLSFVPQVLVGCEMCRSGVIDSALTTISFSFQMNYLIVTVTMAVENKTRTPNSPSLKAVLSAIVLKHVWIWLDSLIANWWSGDTDGQRYIFILQICNRDDMASCFEQDWEPWWENNTSILCRCISSSSSRNFANFTMQKSILLCTNIFLD